MNLVRWHRLMQSLGLPENDLVYEQLIAAYREPERHYHTLTHLENCLNHFDEVFFFFDTPEEVELALWFHDGIYQSHSQQNELHSATWLQKFLRKYDVSAKRIERISHHIMATQNHPITTDLDRQLMLDIDLVILGSSPKIFNQFETNIRKEYGWVPWDIYRQKRLEILETFLSYTRPEHPTRKTLYQTDYFRERYEAQAQQNLTQAIAKLQQQGEISP